MTKKILPHYPVTPEEEAEIQRLIESDPDAPEATDEALAQARPFLEVFPNLAASEAEMDVKFSSKRPLTPEEEAEIQRMIASDPDAPEATDEEIAQAKPFREVFPELAALIDRELDKK